MGDCLATQVLVDFVEGRADAVAQARIEEHASRCTQCREVLSSLARTGAPAGPTQSAPVPDKVGRYVITHELGAGGMGVVYAAHDPELDRRVAVKVLHGEDPGIQERLRREAKAMAQLAHPNVVAVHDVGAFGERMFVTMEYVDGETLAHWLAAAQRTQREIIDAYRAAGAGLAAAHDAGIVHRDFKPENVLAGKDGRIRVVDFGLARTAGGAGGRAATVPGDTAVSPDAPTTPAGALTATGAVMGTPYYMAPEQYGGEPADARSDQFSFCVALFNALYRERPFAGDTLEELRASVCAGKVREPARAQEVPRRIRAAIERGLSVDPAARFGSLADLLVELEPSHRVLRVALPLAAIALVGVGVTTWAVTRSAGDERCTGAAAAFAGAWGPDRRATLERGFAASHLPYAAVAARAAGDALDRYAAAWTAAHGDACRATQIRGEQTEAVMDLRMTCLARRRQDVLALVDTLVAADPDVIAHADEAIGRLPDVAGCADVVALKQVVPVPDDPTTRLKIAALEPALAMAHARWETGNYAPALDIAHRVVANAREVAYRPFEAEAELAEGLIERSLGQFAPAQKSFEAAVWAAEAGRHDEVAARSWTYLVFVVGYDGADYARGAELAQRASAAIARLGGNRDIEAQLEQALGAIAGDQEKLSEATAHFEKAVALEEKQLGPEHPRTLSMLDDVAIAQTQQGHPDRAVAIHRRVLAIREKQLGPGHPLVAQSLHNLGTALMASDAYAEAEQVERRALAIREAALGPDHPDVATTLTDLAHVLRAVNRDDEALVLQRRAIAIGEHAFGPDSPTFARQLASAGSELTRNGDWAEGEAALVRAQAIMTKLNGASHPAVAKIVRARADGFEMQEKYAQAIPLYEQALPVLAAAEGKGDSYLGAAVNLALAYVGVHQPRRALEALKAVDRVGRDHVPPAGLAAIDFTAAQAEWDAGLDHRHAHRLAETARKEVEAGPNPDAEQLQRMDAWLASHR